MKRRFLTHATAVAGTRAIPISNETMGFSLGIDDTRAHIFIVSDISNYECARSAHSSRANSLATQHLKTPIWIKRQNFHISKANGVEHILYSPRKRNKLSNEK